MILIKKAKALVGWLVCAAFIYTAIVFWSAGFSRSLNRTLYAWQDEAYVVAPVLEVVQNGFLSFRCKEWVPTLCYGSTQVFLDAALIKILPSSWVQRDALQREPGAKWYFKPEFPNALYALRMSRGLMMILISVGLAGFAWKLGIPLAWSWVIGLCFIPYDAFTASLAGAKNDFPAALWIIGLFVLFRRAITHSNAVNLRSASLSVIAGVASFGVKFAFVVPVGLFALEVIRRWPGMRQILSLFLLGISTYLVLNFNAFASASEAGWFFPFIVMGGVPFSIQEMKREFFQCWVCHWPILSVWVFLFLTRLTGTRSRVPLFFHLVPVIWFLINLRSAWGRPAYYLLPLIWILMTSAWEASQLSGVKRSRVFLVLAGFLIFCGSLNLLATRNYNIEIQVDPAERVAISPGKNLALDINLRAGLSRVAPSQQGSLLYFDSLSESPADVGALARAKWGGRSFEVWVSCWGHVPGSPAGALWSRLIGQKCARTSPLEPKLIHSFEIGVRPIGQTELSEQELPRVDQKILLEPSLHPRMLKGAHHGIDIWYSPLLLTSDEFLESKLQAPSTSKWIELQLTSTCKSVQSELEIELTSLKNRISLRAPLQVATQLCTEYPMICRMGLKEWWNFRYALPTIKLDFPLKKGDSFEVKFRPRGLNPKDCRLGFSKMEFKS